MIDVHMLLMGNENIDLLQKCLNSLSNHPITLHVCPGIKGDLQSARRNAISKGTNDYIGWVDPDDEVAPGIYSKLLQHAPEHQFVWAKEEIRVYNLNGTLSHSYIRHSPHHIHIVHRDLIKPEFFDPERRADIWVGGLTRHGKFVNEIGYIWNVIPNSNGKLYYETVINKGTNKV